jgi:hydrogenase expression/formation protein HypD
MKFVDEFRDPTLVRKVVDEIHRLVDSSRRYRVMEVCGGHTHAIYRFGLDELLPGNVELIHGPGCPVCVLPAARMDAGLALADSPDVILTTFGDMMRVPGSKGSPLESKSRGADVRIVYSPLDALSIAEANPDRRVVFFAIGFETTAPSTALTILRAAAKGIDNFSVFSNHVLIAPAIRAVLDGADSRLDALIGPGHVSTIIGCRPYDFIASDYGRPVVVSGFEPLDILQSLAMALGQLRRGEAVVQNQYSRAAPPQGNATAQRALEEVFEVRSTFEWRGLGSIAESALGIRAKYARWDAERLASIQASAVVDDAPCGDVLRGAMQPRQCPHFGTACTPKTPIGALMVSPEGACAARYRYARRPEPAAS